MLRDDKVLLGEEFLDVMKIEGEEMGDVGTVLDILPVQGSDVVYVAGREGVAGVARQEESLTARVKYNMPFGDLTKKALSTLRLNAQEKEAELQKFRGAVAPGEAYDYPAGGDLFVSPESKALRYALGGNLLIPEAMLSGNDGELLWMSAARVFGSIYPSEGCIASNLADAPGLEVTSLGSATIVYSESGMLLHRIDIPKEDSSSGHNVSVTGGVHVLDGGNGEYDSLLLGTGFPGEGKYVRELLFAEGKLDSPRFDRVFALPDPPVEDIPQVFVPRQILDIGAAPDAPESWVVYCAELEALSSLSKPRERPIRVFDSDGEQVAALELPLYVPGEGNISATVIRDHEERPYFVVLLRNVRTEDCPPDLLWVCDREGNLAFLQVIRDRCGGVWATNGLLDTDFAVGGTGRLWLYSFRI